MVAFLKKLLVVPPIVLGLLLLYYAVLNREPPTRILPDEPAILARVIIAEPQGVVPRVTGFGTVQPARTWSAVAQVAGRVTEVHPNFVRGGFVFENEVLVRIAQEDYELEIAQAQTDIASAEAELEELDKSRETTTQLLEIERDALVLEEAELARQQELLDRGVASTRNLEEQQRAILQQRAAIQQYENELALMPTRQKALEQSQARAEVQLEIAKLNLARTVVRAPFNGRVSDLDVEIDQFVGSGTVMGSLDSINAAEIDTQVAPSQMVSFSRMAFGKFQQAPGDDGPRDIAAGLSTLLARVSVDFSGNDTGWDAKVLRISDTVDPDTRSVGVIVSVADPYNAIRRLDRPPLVKGMFTQVEIRAPVQEGLYVLPRSAIAAGRIQIAGEDDRLRFADVTVVHTVDDVAFVNGGLETGTRVIVSDLSPAIEGMLLNPVIDEALMAQLPKWALGASPDETALLQDQTAVVDDASEGADQ